MIDYVDQMILHAKVMAIQRGWCVV